MKKLLMVCMGNICRSPMALAVAQKMASDAGRSKQLQFDSAGTHAHHQGEKPDPRAQAVLLRFGYPVGSGRSRKVSAQDFAQFDFILAMDRANLADLQRLCPPAHLGKLRLLLEFSDEYAGIDVPDPYYGNAEGFERVLVLCESGVRGLIRQLA